MNLLTLIVWLAAAPVPGGDLELKLDQYLDASAKVRKFMGSVLVARDGKVIYAEGRGLANLEHDVANTPDTKFRLGSISKQFTAAAVLKLEEQGKLSTADPVCKYVDPCPEAWARITLHHLLTHTAGIPNFTSFPDYRKTYALPSRPQESMGRFRDKPLEFEPGADQRYSNSGYIVLAVVLEKASGKTYEALLDELVFRPLGMNASGSDAWTPVLAHRAAGYRRDGDGFVHADYHDMTIPIGGGSLYSTVTDLLLWDQALYGATLLSKASLEKMFTPFRNNYAYGWVVGERFKRKILEHGGGINGFSTVLTRYPDDRTLVVVLSNVEGGNPGAVGRDVAAILFGEAYEVPRERVAIKVDPSLYDAYVGRYELRPNFILTVTRDGDRLMAQATGQPQLELFPESETKFFLKAVDAQLTFVKGADGKVTHAVLHQGGDREARKIE